MFHSIGFWRPILYLNHVKLFAIFFSIMNLIEALFCHFKSLSIYMKAWHKKKTSKGLIIFLIIMTPLLHIYHILISVMMTCKR